MRVNSVFPFDLLVRWDDPASFLPLPANMQDWLLDTGSLTERLQANCQTFSVRVLGQAQAELSKAEKTALTKYTQSHWQIREVILYGDAQPWVFARSVLPQSLCESAWSDLGDQPLGQRIFNDSRFVRSGFEIGTLDKNPLTQQPFSGAGAGDTCWARRSIFSIEEHEVLVAEAFLPDCPCYKAPS